MVSIEPRPPRGPIIRVHERRVGKGGHDWIMPGSGSVGYNLPTETEAAGKARVKTLR